MSALVDSPALRARLTSLWLLCKLPTCTNKNTDPEFAIMYHEPDDIDNEEDVDKDKLTPDKNNTVNNFLNHCNSSEICNKQWGSLRSIQ